jgi:sulfate adenylyltransferase
MDAPARRHPVAGPGLPGRARRVRVDTGRLALRDERGGLHGVLEVAEVFERDRRAEAELVYGTTDPAHPGVARVLGAPARALAGCAGCGRTRRPGRRAAPG